MGFKEILFGKKHSADQNNESFEKRARQAAERADQIKRARKQTLQNSLDLEEEQLAKKRRELEILAEKYITPLTDKFSKQRPFSRKCEIHTRIVYDGYGYNAKNVTGIETDFKRKINYEDSYELSLGIDFNRKLYLGNGFGNGLGGTGGFGFKDTDGISVDNPNCKKQIEDRFIEMVETNSFFIHIDQTQTDG